MPGELFFRADALTMGTAALSGRVLFASLAFSLGLLIVTLLFGRVFCGWACPLGTVVDVFDFVSGRSKKAVALKRVKYHLLVVIICLALFGIALAWIIDPMTWSSRIDALIFPNTRLDWATIPIVITMLIIIEILLGKRGFCRVLCPLGALLGITSTISLFGRKLSNSCTTCGHCTKECRTAAIGKDPKQFSRSECIHCQDCVVNCKESALHFQYLKPSFPNQPDPIRREYLLSLGGGAAAGLLFRSLDTGQTKKEIIRPPGAVTEDRFSNLCIRCGACVRVCPTGGLSPAINETGPLDFQTPILNTREGGCAFDCNACGRVCPSGAIQKLPLNIKQKEKIGLAAIDPKRCIPSAKNTACLICYAACPLSAITLVDTEKKLKWGDGLSVPKVVKESCTGCGLCETSCPLLGNAAIQIAPPSDKG